MLRNTTDLINILLIFSLATVPDHLDKANPGKWTTLDHQFHAVIKIIHDKISDRKCNAVKMHRKLD